MSDTDKLIRKSIRLTEKQAENWNPQTIRNTLEAKNTNNTNIEEMIESINENNSKWFNTLQKNIAKYLVNLEEHITGTPYPEDRNNPTNLELFRTLMNEIKDIKIRLESKIDDIQTSICVCMDLETNINSLQEDLEHTNNKISDLEDQTKELKEDVEFNDKEIETDIKDIKEDLKEAISKIKQEIPKIVQKSIIDYTNEQKMVEHYSDKKGDTP